MKKLKCWRAGTIKIVSSGYADRYALSTVWTNIEKNGVRYRIDSANQAGLAYIELSGMDFQAMTEKDFADVSLVIHRSEFNLSATYKNGATTGTIRTTSGRLNAGIKMATGFPGLNEIGIAHATETANTLSREEWLCVRTGLEAINKTHAETGRPVVEFEIPEVVA